MTFALALLLGSVVSAAPPDKKELLALAEKGDVKAQLTLALRHRDGHDGVKKDPVAGMQWARRAADGGSVEALDAVGFAYLHGIGVPENHDVAVGYFRAAARQKCAAGVVNLGDCYFSGLGLEQDYAKAIEQWERAAGMGRPDAAFRLAMIYAAGDGAPRDAAAATKWCKIAADAEHTDALVMLGELRYEAGETDAAKAAWDKAAAAGSKSAKVLLKLLPWRGKKAEPGKFAYVEYRHVHQGWNNCGATSCTMFAKSQGSKATHYDIKRLCPEEPIGTGTDWSDLVVAAGKLGLKWKLVTYPNDEAGFAEGTKMLRSELDAGRAVVIDFNFPDGTGHTVTVAGYNLADDVYVIRDPAHTSPGLRLMSSKVLAKWRQSLGYSRVSTGRCRPAIMWAGEK
ncbi:MAG: C39 family peptidase [Fimbriiglobus sp.]